MYNGEELEKIWETLHYKRVLKMKAKKSEILH